MTSADKDEAISKFRDNPDSNPRFHSSEVGVMFPMQQ